MKNQTTHKGVDFFPPHLCKAFEDGLSALIADTLVTQGFRGEYLLSEYKSKYVGEDTLPAKDRRAAAIKKWLSTEARNERTNQRLFLDDVDFGWTTSDSFVEYTKKYISKVLGPCRPELILQQGFHTNGASTRVKRGPTASILKHGGKLHISSTCLKHWFTFASGTRLSSQPLEIQECSVMFTVPKSTEIDRVACKEPEGNMLLQRCAGSFIRRRLRRKGIDLNDQTVNQQLAKVALVDGLATIDLSSASDSISNSLVMRLLPADWWSFLDDLRVHYTSIDSEVHRLHMFSSMGNGFTFELESLLFFAITRTIKRFSRVPGRISVYGDDIIAPCEIVPRMVRFFSFLGFTVNEKKSHWRGWFRESCGKHYYKSVDVTPFYLRRPIQSMTDVIRVLNQLYKWDQCLGVIVTPEVLKFHRVWSEHVPKRLWGGQDPDEITSLVTGHAPRSRLVPKVRDVPFPEHLGLEAWLTAKEAIHLPLSYDPFRERGYKTAVNRDEALRIYYPWLLESE